LVAVEKKEVLGREHEGRNSLYKYLFGNDIYSVFKNIF
jgi:hypothetical protein